MAFTPTKYGKFRVKQTTFLFFLSIAWLWILIGIPNQPFKGDGRNLILETKVQSEDLLQSVTLVEDLYRDNFIKAVSDSNWRTFDPAPIQEICSRQKWKHDLVFRCGNVEGGWGNLHNMMLFCIRFAMMSGGGLVVPGISQRKLLNTSGSINILHEYDRETQVDMDYIFDADLFFGRMAEACPQMRLFHGMRAIPGPRPVVELPLLKLRKNLTVEYSMDKLKTHLKQNKTPAGSIKFMTLIAEYGPFDICLDGVDFVDNFGLLLPQRTQASRVGAAVIFELSEQHDLRLDPDFPISLNSYTGIHLRTAADAVKVKWVSYEYQAAQYSKLINEYHPPVVYAASGNLSSIDLFADVVAPIPVVTKFTLLSGKNELAELEAMTWDQQALVDSFVLERSAHFMGMNASSYSWKIALSRRKFGSRGTCLGKNYTEYDERDHKEEIVFQDELSVIVGQNASFQFSEGTWPP
ncbi:hypothetical protein PVAG01_10487 [Phlyctema vagabunda]|uniref:Uncharacterized protein n=1 Tax=Phlyctema vagabunda TaxID=108571 RepID=A0ABR4P2F5_9HELO